MLTQRQDSAEESKEIGPSQIQTMVGLRVKLDIRTVWFIVFNIYFVLNAFVLNKWYFDY